MKRPIVWFAAAFACGIFVYINFSMSALLIMSGCWLFTVFAYEKPIYFSLVAVMLAGTALGFIYEARVLEPVTYYDGKEDFITGTVEEIQDGYLGQYVYKVENAKIGKLEGLSGRIYSYEKLSEGDIAKFKGEITAVNNIKSGYSFDYRAYLINRDIVFTANANSASVIGKKEKDFGDTIKDLRNFLIKRTKKLAGPSSGGFLAAALMGYREGIDRYTKEIFQKTGLTHLLVVSGMHVSALLGFLYMLLQKAPRFLTAAAGTIFLVLMVFLIGSEASVMRAVIMGIMVLWADVIYADSDPLSNLCTAAVVILAFRPYSLIDGGFILSFTASGGIIILSPKFKGFFLRTLKAPLELLSVTLAVYIFLIPANIYYNGEITLLALVSNLIFTTIFPAIMVLLLITLPLGGIMPFLPRALDFVTGAYIDSVDTFSKIPAVTLKISPPSEYFVLLALAAVLFFILKNKRMRYMLAASSLCLAVICGMEGYILRTTGKIYMMDTENLQNVIIATPDLTFMAIRGEKSVSSSEIENLTGFLEKSRIKNIDILFTINYNKGTELASRQILEEYSSKEAAPGEYELWDGVKVFVGEDFIEVSGDKSIAYFPYGGGGYKCESQVIRSMESKTVTSVFGDEFKIDRETLEISFDKQGVKRLNK